MFPKRFPFLFIPPICANFGPPERILIKKFIFASLVGMAQWGHAAMISPLSIGEVRKVIEMRKFISTYLNGSLLLAFLAMVLVSCGGGGDGSNSGTTPPPPKSVVITGTVPGTVAIAYELATGKEADRNVASGTPKTFSLSLAPGTYYLMFIENEGTSTQRSFAFRNVTGGNVFTFKANTTLDLGVLVFNNPTAMPLVDRISGNDNVTESLKPEASFSPGAGEWVETRKFVNSTCSGHSPGTTVTGNITIGHGFGIVTYTPAGTTETAGGSVNVNTAILTASSAGALETIHLTMQSDGSLEGTYSKVGYGGGCSEEATITAVLGTSPPPPATTLTGLSISGPSSMPEYGTATYTATANWSDNSTSSVTPTWSVNPQVAEISTGGVLSCQGGVGSDQSVTITATYSSGGITETAAMGVTIIHVYSIPFTVQELSGKVFFEENFYAGGGYDSHLYRFNADFSLERYSYKNSPDMSDNVTGTWSTDPYGVHLNISGQGAVTVQRVAESSTGITMLIYDGPGPPSVVTWEKIVPVDPAKLPGTYKQSVEGYTWVFNADGTGSVSIFGGITFTWSVDSAGVLRMPSTTGYTAVFYARASSQSTATSYTSLKVGFPEFKTSSGDFYSYYGGRELTRQ